LRWTAQRQASEPVNGNAPGDGGPLKGRAWCVLQEAIGNSAAGFIAAPQESCGRLIRIRIQIETVADTQVNAAKP
jgi:hypothetical protein